MSSTAITYLDIELTVDYDFEAGQLPEFDHPGFADEAYINAVIAGGVDIKDLISSDDLELISQRVAASHVEERTEKKAREFV